MHIISLSHLSPLTNSNLYITSTSPPPKLSQPKTQYHVYRLLLSLLPHLVPTFYPPTLLIISWHPISPPKKHTQHPSLLHTYIHIIVKKNLPVHYNSPTTRLPIDSPSLQSCHPDQTIIEIGTMIHWRHVLPDRLLYYCWWYCCWWVLVDSWLCVFVKDWLIDCVIVYCVVLSVLWCMLFIEPHTKALSRPDERFVVLPEYCYFAINVITTTWTW